MSKPAHISYVIMVALLVLIGWFHLGVLVLTALFGYFALQQFSFGRSKFLGVALYIIATRMVRATRNLSPLLHSYQLDYRVGMLTDGGVMISFALALLLLTGRISMP